MYQTALERRIYYKAVVYGRVGIFATCFGAAIIYVANGHILWVETFALMIGSIIGSSFGMQLAKKIKAHVAKILLRFITALLIMELILEMVKG